MKRFLFFLYLFVDISIVIAQTTNYYIATRTFEVDGCTYQCDVPSYGMVYIYKKDNPFRDIPMLYKGTTEVYGTPENEDIPVIERSSYKSNAPKYKAIIRELFNKYHGKLESDDSLIVTLFLDSQTGKVREVEFSFHRDESFGLIPIEDFIRVEQELKEKIQITPTSEGKKLNYIFFWWEQYP